VISLAVFGKWFQDPIEERYIGGSGTTTRTFTNADDATNYGVEIEVNHGLGWLHSGLEPFTLFGNLTLMESVVKVDESGEENRPLVGQAPYVVNSGVAYADQARGLSATLLYNVVGDRIVNARSLGADVVDVVERPRHLVDLTLRFPLIGSATAKIDLENLLDSPFKLEQGPVLREHYRTGRSVSLGITWRQ
jgi:outer membrane receptor protein involved in Fe transport